MSNRRLDPKNIAKKFWREGFVHLPGFFTASVMDRLNGLIEGHFGTSPAFEHSDEFLQKSATEVVPWFPRRAGVEDFDLIERDKDFRALTEAILGEGWEDQYCMVMFSKEGTQGQAWHQDCPPEGKYYNLNRLIYTSDIVEEIGGQVMVKPRSHIAGELTVGDPHDDLEGQIVLSPKKGDLLFLHGHCWHRVSPIKKKYRFSTNFRAASAGAPEDLTDICVYRNMRFKFSTSEVVVDRTIAPPV